MTKLLARLSILMLMMFIRPVQAQQLTPAETFTAIDAIKLDPSATNSEKIQRLLRLQELFLKWNKKPDSVYARIVHRIGDMYSQTGDWEKAIQYTKEAVTINRGPNKKLSENSFLTHSYLNLGVFYKELYLFTDARLYFDSCIDIGRNFSEKYFIVFMAYERKAYTFFQMGDYQKCIETADNGMLFAQQVKETLKEAILLSQKAQAQVEMNDIRAAEQNIKRSLSILESSTDTINLAISYSIYANFLLKKGLPKASIEYYQKAFELNKAKNNWQQCSRDMLDLGYVYDIKLRASEKALSCYKIGITMVEKVKDAYQLAGLYINMGVVYWGKQNFKTALQFYQKALNVLPIKFTDTSIKRNPSENMLRLVANDYFVSTLLSNKAEALLGLYQKEKKQELLEAALTTYQAADKAVDLMRWKQSSEKSKLFWREKTRKMYENAISVCYLLKDSKNGYYFFEKSRAVLLNDKLSELGAKKFIAVEDRAKEEQLRIKVFSYNQQLTLLKETDPALNKLRQQYFSAQQEWENFVKSLEKKYPLYYQYKYNSTVQPLTEVRSMLRHNNQSLIEFFTADSTLYVLFVSPTADKLVKVSFRDYSKVSREFMNLCSDQSQLNLNFNSYRALAFQLYDRLFKPLDVPAGRVIISPDDYFIPFDALLSDENDASSFLVKKYAFSYAYSMGVLLQNGVAAPARDNSLLGVAPINYQSHLQMQSLQGADHSLKKLDPYFKKTRYLIKEDATKHQFLNYLSRYRTVQIYSHADADSTGTQPVLYLQDSILNLSEIQSLENMHTDMIVLSACKTGIGKHAKGEGVFSLARAFMGAGIPSTVTTLWQVDNQATYTITEAFYKHLNTGVTKDVAMQKAKLEFMHTGDKMYELPYYWAGNILLGKTNNAIVEKSSSKKFSTIFIIMISFLLLLMAYFVYAKRIALREP